MMSSGTAVACTTSRGSGAASKRRPTKSLFRFTAMRMSAPKARQTETGTGLTSPPSSNQSSSCFTGLKMPGMPMEARTASAMGPALSHISRPVTRLVATAANGLAACSIDVAIPSWLMRAVISSPCISPPPVKRMSTRLTISRRVSAHAHVVNSDRRPVTYAAPTKAPIEVPHTISGSMPAS